MRTAAVEDPVIIPGTIIRKTIPRDRTAGNDLNLRIIHAATDSRSPVASMVFMKIIAVAIIRIVSM